MKKIIFPALLSIVSANAVADGIGELALSVSAPTASTRAWIQCDNGNMSGCFDMVIAGPFSTSTLAFLAGVLLKEEMAQVEPDAMNFIAGEEMSLALEEMLLKLRSNEELNALSDEELAIVLIKSLQN